MKHFYYFCLGILIIFLTIFFSKTVSATIQPVFAPNSLAPLEVSDTSNSGLNIPSTENNGLSTPIKIAVSRASLSYPLPDEYPVTSGFGYRTHPIDGSTRFHEGIDIGAPEGTPVLAVRPGVVLQAELLGGYGNAVVLQHENPLQQTLYAHLLDYNVTYGQTVDQGDIIGYVGSTGNSTGPHLHFELLELNGSEFVAVNPAGRLGGLVSPSEPSAPQPEPPLVSCDQVLFGTQCQPTASSSLAEYPKRPSCDVALFGYCD
jgi:murein DD-endopeptidase MepM/ murein hydrolase activator NlpD